MVDIGMSIKDTEYEFSEECFLRIFPKEEDFLGTNTDWMREHLKEYLLLVLEKGRKDKLLNVRGEEFGKDIFK